MVSFTGSTAVGQADPGPGRADGEAGGARARRQVGPDLPARRGRPRRRPARSRSSPMTAGQACVAATRMLVPRDRKDEVLDAVSGAYAALTVGPPTDPTTMMGPVISAGQRERCERFVGLAEEHGGKVAAGGGRPAGVRPRLLLRADRPRPARQREPGGAGGDLRSGASASSATTTSTTRCASPTTASTACRRRCTAPTWPPRPTVARRLRTGAVNVNTGVFSAYAPERRLQAERPRSRAGTRRHPRVPGGQAHGDRRAAMSGLDDLTEPRLADLGRRPHPRAARTSGSTGSRRRTATVPRTWSSTTGIDFWVYDGKRFPSSGLSAVAGKSKEEFSPEPLPYSRDAPGCYDSGGPPRGHGPRRHPGVAVLPDAARASAASCSWRRATGSSGSSACRPTTTG